MAENIRYCKQCGAKLRAGAKFCKECGTKVAAAAGPAPAQEKPVQRTCPDCGKPVSDKAKFCRNCGHRFEGTAAAPASHEKVNAPATPAVHEKMNAPAAPARREKQFGIAASASPGEFALMDLSPNKIPGAAKVKEVGSTFSALGGGLKSFLAGIPGIFTSPVTLISTIVLAGLWIWLGMKRGSDSTIIKILSWITFSEGGFNRNEIGALGGIVGKGVVGVVLASVFSGGFKKLGSGIGAVFGKTGSKRSVIAMMIGAITGMVLYYVFVGKANATGATAMAGISGAVLCLQALGSKSGNIYRIAEAFTSKKINGVRTAMDGRINSLLSGVTIGFALITVLAPIV